VGELSNLIKRERDDPPGPAGTDPFFIATRRARTWFERGENTLWHAKGVDLDSGQTAFDLQGPPDQRAAFAGKLLTGCLGVVTVHAQEGASCEVLPVLR
jgi:hypothetical protein